MSECERPAKDITGFHKHFRVNEDRRGDSESLVDFHNTGYF